MRNPNRLINLFILQLALSTLCFFSAVHAEPQASKTLSEIKIFPLNEDDLRSYYNAKHAFYDHLKVPYHMGVDITQFRYISAYQGVLQQIMDDNYIDEVMFSMLFMDIDMTIYYYIDYVDRINKEPLLKAELEALEKEFAGIDKLSSDYNQRLQKLNTLKSQLESIQKIRESENAKIILQNMALIKKYAHPLEHPELNVLQEEEVKNFKSQIPQSGSIASARTQDSTGDSPTSSNLDLRQESEWDSKYKMHQKVLGGTES